MAIVFTSRSLPVTRDWTSVAKGGGAWVAVAVGTATAIRSVNNGASWATVTLPLSGDWQAICHDGTAFIIVGPSTTALTSTDGGATWQQQTMPVGEWSALAVRGSLVVATSSSMNAKAATSTDHGVTWAEQANADGGISICDTGTAFVVVGGSAVATSPAGTAWTPRTVPTAPTLLAVRHRAGRVTAVGAGKWATSDDDGATWTVGDMPNAGAYYAGLEWADGVWIAVDDSSNASATSIDGQTWGAGPNLPSAGLAGWRAMGVADNTLVVLKASGNLGATAPVTMPVSLPPPLASGTPTLGLTIAVVPDSAWALAALRKNQWSASLRLGANELWPRVVGDVTITAGESRAAVASFAFAPSAGPVDLDGWVGQPLTIDYQPIIAGQPIAIRRFTGRVESIDVDVAGGLVKVYARDGWQERIAACTTAAAVESLCGGLAAVAPEVLAFVAGNADTYFRGLTETMPGATVIDAAGFWRVVPWRIGAPRATFTADDVVDRSLALTLPNRVEAPRYVDVSFTHRYPRLHRADVGLGWAGPALIDIALDASDWCTRETLVAAINGLSDWQHDGEPSIDSPVAGSYSLGTYWGVPIYYTVPADVAPLLAVNLAHTVYRRWYQEVEVTFATTLDFGSGSERHGSVSAAVASTFDTAAWETPPTKAQTAIIAANIPPGGSSGWGVGYETDPLPAPPADGALDHLADIDGASRNRIAAHLVAKAVRQVTEGRRQRAVNFVRPLDPRLDIGTVVAISGVHGVAATGQVDGLTTTLGGGSGRAVVQVNMAVPEGNAAATTSAATATAAPPAVTHALVDPMLGNYAGARNDTPTTPVLDDLQGWIYNCKGGPRLDASKPTYDQQFRVVLPEIPAAVRDPLAVAGSIAANWSIAAGSLTWSI